MNKSNYIKTIEVLVKTANLVIEKYKNSDVKYSQKNREFGLNAKFADCSSTIHTIFKESNLQHIISGKTTSQIKDEIKKLGGSFRKNDPFPGDIMMWNKHITIVTKVNEKFVYFAHMGFSGPKIGKAQLSNCALLNEDIWGSGGFIGFWTIPFSDSDF